MFKKLNDKIDSRIRKEGIQFMNSLDPDVNITEEEYLEIEQEINENAQSPMLKEFKRMRCREMLVNGILAIILCSLGYWLAFSSKRPACVILPESMVVGAEKGVFTMFPLFHWGALVVAAGCVMLTCGVVHLVTVLANLKYEILDYKRRLIVFEKISSSFQYVFRSFLCLLFYITSWGIFENLASIYFGLNERNYGHFNVMVFQKPILYAIIILGVLVGIQFLIQMAVGGCASNTFLDKTAIIWGICVVVGLVINVSINWWYLLVCLVAVLVYWGIERLIKWKTTKEVEAVAQILEKLDIKF